MKAFIFNSGVGTRLGELTKNTPKGLVRMETGETILGRQIRILRDCGIKDFVITTGPFHEKINDFVEKIDNITATLINSDNYLNTNSIYSMYIASDLFNDDFLILHGDLVFDHEIVERVLKDDNPNLVLINKSIPRPEKDFKGRIENGFLREISVDIFDDNCFALQPFYKLNLSTIKLWLDQVQNFIAAGDVKVYAENALNKILHLDLVKTFDYANNYMDEIDNLVDFKRVSDLISESDYKNQSKIISLDYKKDLLNYLKENNLNRPFLLHGQHILKDPDFIELVAAIKPTLFSGFSPNPKYEEILIGHSLFKQSNSDIIIAIGGGSCIDVAKAIKLYSPYESNNFLISTPNNYVDLKLVAIPTTAGTGSESTRFSVMYYQGDKISLTNDSLLPNLAILCPTLLTELPLYQRKATLLDALCQAIEGYWSVNSNQTAMVYSEIAIKKIMQHYKAYISGSNNNNLDILLASNYAGAAINIAKTTAPHAMSYMLTSVTGIAHGHAVSLTLPHVYEYMINNLKLSNPKLDEHKLIENFVGLTECFGRKNYKKLSSYLSKLFSDFEMQKPEVTKEELEFLVYSVNIERLDNSPVIISESALRKIYGNALQIKKRTY